MTLVIAHRGSHESRPENTLAAFAAAAENGADMVELDVRRTRDGQLAIFHDPELARTSPANLTLEELRAGAGRDVPVLEDVIAWATEAGVGLDVELKEDGYVETVARLLAAFDGRLIATSFIDPVLAQLAVLAPAVPRGLLLGLTATGAVTRVRRCGAQAAVIEMKQLNPRLLEELATARLDAYLWGFLAARSDHTAWLGDERITAVITDDVPGLRRALA